MRNVIYLISLLLTVIFIPSTLRAETADDFLKAYFLIQDGDAADKGGEKEKAVEKYSSALKILREIKRNTPDWNPNIIAYRSKYCGERIIKAGGKIDPEESVSPSATETVSTPTPQATPINTVPPNATIPTSPSPTDLSPAPAITTVSDGASSERVTNLERELKQAREELRKVQNEKSDLEARLKKTEEELKSSSSTGNERVQALLKENNDLKQKLSETEEKLKYLPSNSDEITSLKADLEKMQIALAATKKENEELRLANETLKKDLEETRTQLKTATSSLASTITPEVLQTLQRENSLLRSIVDRQFQEDAKRMVARDILTLDLKELGSRSETVRKQLEILQTPLTPLTEEERQLLKTPGTSLRASDDPTKLSGVVTAKRNSNDNAAIANDAKRLFAQGDMNGAASKYEQIIQSEPNNLIALSNLGVIHFRQDRIDEAEKNLRAALQIDPRDAFSMSVLGIVYYRQGKYDDALSVLTKAIAIEPKNHETHNYLGITYSQKGYQEAAEKELLKAIELQPNYGDAQFNMAVVFASQNPPSMELARKHYKKAIELGVAKDPELEKLFINK